MDETKTQGQERQDLLCFKSKNAWEKVSDVEKNEAFEFCEKYKEFLNKAKTEREFVSVAKEMAIQKGFIALEEILLQGANISPGMKIYYTNRNKSMILAVIGKESPAKGVNIIGTHIDAPRLDLKQNPLYEDSELAMFKTHYYGGIKKYQWLTIPLALHGVVIKGNGELVNLVAGENETDPVLTITDLLPHLAQDQMEKKMSEAVQGEGMNLIVGSIPYIDEKAKDKVKLFILDILFQKYNIIEEDLQSAELEIVPAFKARDVGLDRSLIGAYGQDNRACAYPSLEAILNLDSIPNRTAICIFTDKEEIGSVGNTGAQSKLLENFLADISCVILKNSSEINLRNCLRNSTMLSADVNAAVDPNYEGVQDKRNATYLGKGIAIQKYTGSKGKHNASDASAEFVGKIRKIFNDNHIIWQSGELGKVDQGGGGTVALFAANLGMDVLDCGVSVQSMHSPFEITCKVDIYISYKAYLVFYKYCQ